MRRTLCILFFFLFLGTACAPQSASSTPKPVNLIPYLPATQAPPPLTPEGLVPLTAPLPSPTPFTYTVQKGDTLITIAQQFGVSLDDLQTANPEVNANAMSVGQVLHIPSNPNNPSGEPTPTPAPFTVEQIECYPTTNKGMWCFVLAHNDSPFFMENLSAQVTLVDTNNAFLATQTALLPLDILPPNTSLPLTVYFPPDVPFDSKPQVQILTAIRLLPDDARYLPATLNNTLVQVNADGHFAQVSGDVLLLVESKAATHVWVVAVAYDENGRVVGVKCWEGGGVQPGGSLQFRMTVASLGGEMTRVEFAVEARP